MEYKIMWQNKIQLVVVSNIKQQYIAVIYVQQKTVKKKKKKYPVIYCNYFYSN